MSSNYNFLSQLLVREFEAKLNPQRRDLTPKKTAGTTTPGVIRQRMKPNRGKQLHALQEEESTTKVHRRVHDALTDELANRTLQLKRQNLAIQELIHKDSKVSKD